MIACNMDTTRVCHPLREPFARLGSGFVNLDKTKGDITYWTVFHTMKDATIVRKWDARWGSPRKFAILEPAVYRDVSIEEYCIANKLTVKIMYL
jgi:hypothetical protein